MGGSLDRLVPRMSFMPPTLCLIGGCNGAGKTTLAFELLPRLGILRFLNADEIARGLSPLDPSLGALHAGRLVIEQARSLIAGGTSFAIESTLGGRTHLGLIERAKRRGFHVILHYILLATEEQAEARVALRVSQGGHDVAPADIRRRFRRSRERFLADYLPLADEWGVWDNSTPPIALMADSRTHRPEDVKALLESPPFRESPPEDWSEMIRLCFEASRAATAKKRAYYKRMGIRVTPQMTLAPPPAKRRRSSQK